MKLEEIKRLFPIKFTITEDILKTEGSIGTKLLKSILPEELHEDLFWGLSIGTVKGVKLKTEHVVLHEGELITVPLYLDSSLKEGTEIEFKLR